MREPFRSRRRDCATCDEARFSYSRRWCSARSRGARPDHGKHRGLDHRFLRRSTARRDRRGHGPESPGHSGRAITPTGRFLSFSRAAPRRIRRPDRRSSTALRAAEKTATVSRRRDRDRQHGPAACRRGAGRRVGRGPARGHDLDDDRDELHEQSASRSPPRGPQLRRHRAREPGVVDGPRRHAGALARPADLRRDLGREPVDHRRRQHDERL